MLVEEQQETEAESEESRSGRGQEEDVRRILLECSKDGLRTTGSHESRGVT